MQRPRPQSTFTKSPTAGAQSTSAPPVAIGKRGDALETEADRLANRVTRGAWNAQAPRVGTDASTEHLPAEQSALIWRAAAAPGKPLEAPVQNELGRATGYDFKAVRVHADAASAEATRALGTRAYTYGSDIFFSPAHYEPHSASGMRVLAHELAHVKQQASSPTPFVQRDSGHTQNAPADRTLEILPPRGAIEAINRQVELQEIFGARLEELVNAILANPEALQVTRRHGVAGVLAIYSTRTAKGLNPKAALKQLQEEQEPRKSYWFQDKPPEPRTETTKEGIEIHRAPSLNDVTEDDTTSMLSIKGSSVPTLAVKFAASSRDYDSDRIKLARTLVIDGVKKVLADLDTIPTGLPGKAKAEARETRARLKEVLRGFDKTKPLRIFLSTNPGDGRGGVRGRTENIFVNVENVGDDTKLQAAILIPLETLLGRKGGAAALSGDEIAATTLHEMLHALLFRHGINAAVLATQIKGKVVSGPAPIQHRCEFLIAAMLQAQEELFVYDAGSKLGRGYEIGLTRETLAIWLELARKFFEARKTRWTAVHKKIDVAEKVTGKRIDWAFDYRYPEQLAVTNADFVEIEEILAQHPHLD